MHNDFHAHTQGKWGKLVSNHNKKIVYFTRHIKPSTNERSDQKRKKRKMQLPMQPTARNAAHQIFRKKSNFPPSTLACVRFSSPNYKTRNLPSSNFENRSFYVPGRFWTAVRYSNRGFATVPVALPFYF
jgi:hypothetical protein